MFEERQKFYYKFGFDSFELSDLCIMLNRNLMDLHNITKNPHKFISLIDKLQGDSDIKEIFLNETFKKVKQTLNEKVIEDFILKKFWDPINLRLDCYSEIAKRYIYRIY